MASFDSTRAEKWACVKHLPFLFLRFAEDDLSILRVREEWSLEMRWPWFLTEPLGVQGPWRGARWVPVGPSCPLAGSKQPAHRLAAGPPGETFPSSAFPGLPSHREPSHTTPLKASQHLSLSVKRNRSGEKKRAMELSEGISRLRSRGCLVCAWGRTSHCNGTSCSVTVF